MVCRNICVDYKAKKPVGGMRYLAGQKRCQNCDLFITGRAADAHAVQQNCELVLDEKDSNK